MPWAVQIWTDAGDSWQAAVLLLVGCTAQTCLTHKAAQLGH